MSFMLTTRLPSRGDVCKVVPLSRAQLVMDDDGELVIDWMKGSPAPEAVLQLLACKRVRTCKLPDCTCLANGLKCTDMCRLQTCDNQPNKEVFDVDLEESDIDDDGD